MSPAGKARCFFRTTVGNHVESTSRRGKVMWLLMEKVVLGEYTLVVGSDMDNDGIICDAGEA